MLSLAALGTLLGSLFATMNPFGNLAIFATLTEDRSPRERLATAWRTAAATIITLLVVIWAGQWLLGGLGISIDALQTAGGLILLKIGFGMLSNDTSHAHTPKEDAHSRERDAISVVPMAIPVLAGPGTMSVVLIAAHANADVLGKLGVSGAAVIGGLICGTVLGLAGPLTRLLGRAGMGVMTRIMGMVLSAIGVGMLATGVRALLPGLAG